MLAGQTGCGTPQSMTVTLNAQFAVMPAASVATQFTVVPPFGNSEPDGGVQTTVAVPQASLEPAEKVTKAVCFPLSTQRVMSAGHVIDGAAQSVTVTVKEQLAVLPPEPVATHVTVVVPFVKVEPEAGWQAIWAPVDAVTW